MESNLEIKVGVGEYEGKTYTYLYVSVELYGKTVDIRLKPNSTFEKELIIALLSK
ncbi:MAG: hypothetical protein QXN68_05685 [Thermoplasmata archaeon]